jgi:hypothetical protein
LIKILSPVKENGLWRTKNSHELMDLHKELDIISEIGKGRL